jgi:SAM-dependent methyltransferase
MVRENARAGEPSAWVRRFIGGVPEAAGPVLDVACGGGRHLQLALSRGYSVVGVDRDLARVADLEAQSGVELIEADLEQGGPWPLGGRQFAGVIVTNYLWRPILGAVAGCVSPEGLLIYETFASGNARFGKPSNPAFLLEPGELIEAVAGRLTVIAYEHATLSDPDRVVARIAAVGPLHRWRRDPPRV